MRVAFSSSAGAGALLAVLACGSAGAQDGELELRLEALQQTVERQQAELDRQREQIAEQLELIRRLEAVLGASSVTGVQRDEPLAPSDDSDNGQSAAAAELARREIEGTAERRVDSQATLYDPSTSVFDPAFPGAWHLPGTTAAMRIGGFVNLALVNSFDPLVARDRFVVGSIPSSGVAVGLDPLSWTDFVLPSRPLVRSDASSRS